MTKTGSDGVVVMAV